MPCGSGLALHKVTSAAEMLAAAQPLFAGADAVVYVAAVADYTVAQREAHKRPKSAKGLTVKLVPTPDIAATLCRKKRRGQVCIGFALETSDGLAKARAKLERKGLDAIVLNDVTSFGADDGEFTLLQRGRAQPEAWGRLDKRECARRIISALADLA
jgi:phosphopantothenoylcysteine decarboxylase/phosphopantothenate--cysteine ligase